MQRPEHHHPASGLDPASPDGDNRFAGHADPGLSGKTEMGHTAGQPDTWPQRPDVEVPQRGGEWPLFGGKIAD